MSLNKINNSFGYFILNLLAFSIPLNKVLLSPLIILFVGSSIIHFVANKYKINNLNKSSLLLPALFYLLYVTGLLYSDDMNSGGFDLEVKLSLILLPLCFLVNPFAGLRSLITICNKFILGCATAMLLCFISAYLDYYIAGNFESFFYDSLSIYRHPGYFAMYLVFAVSLVLLYVMHNYEKLPKLNLIALVTFVVLCGTFIIMLTSKAGIISFAGVLFTFFIYFILRYKQYVIGFGMIVLIFIISFIAVNKSETLKRRIAESFSALSEKQVQNDNDLETTSLRKVIWKSSFKLIKANVFGYGTGDVNNVLSEQYKKDGNLKAEHKHLNAHNQFLQTTLALGIFGLFVLLAMLIYPIFSLTGIQKIIFIFFIISIIVFCLTESILETQSGIIFFAFFFCFIVSGNNINEQEQITL